MSELAIFISPPSPQGSSCLIILICPSNRASSGHRRGIVGPPPAIPIHFTHGAEHLLTILGNGSAKFQGSGKDVGGGSRWTLQVKPCCGGGCIAGGLTPRKFAHIFVKTRKFAVVGTHPPQICANLRGIIAGPPQQGVILRGEFSVRFSRLSIQGR